MSGSCRFFGLHYFHTLTASLNPPLRILFPSAPAYDRALAGYLGAVREALLTEYRVIFLITSAVCLAGAAVAVFIGGGGVRRRTPVRRRRTP